MNQQSIPKQQGKFKTLRQAGCCLFSEARSEGRFLLGTVGSSMRTSGARKENLLAGAAQWIEHELRTKGSLVRFPARAHAWVAGHMRGNHALMFFSLSSPL